MKINVNLKVKENVRFKNMNILIQAPIPLNNPGHALECNLPRFKGI